MNIITRHVRIGLNILGAWPGVSATKFFFFMIGFFIFSLVFQIWHTALVIKELNMLMSNLGTTMPLTSVVMKLSMFRLKYRSIKLVVSEMLEDWKSEKGIIERKLMMKNTKIAVYLSNVIAFCYNGLVIFYLIIAVLSYSTEDINSRQYVMHAAFPINAKKSPIFEILCILQFLVAWLCANSHAVMEGLLTLSVLHSNTKATGICHEIWKFSKICQTSNNKGVILEAKKNLIKKHVNFLNFADSIQDIFAYVSFFHLLLMTLINCIVGYMLINLKSINQDTVFTLFLCIAYMFTAVSAVASYCIAGEYLTSQGTLIFNGFYNCPWYTFKPADTKLLIFVIMRSRQPVTISAGSFGVLSLVYFTQIIKTSVSYLSLIRASDK